MATAPAARIAETIAERIRAVPDGTVTAASGVRVSDIGIPPRTGSMDDPKVETSTDRRHRYQHRSALRAGTEGRFRVSTEAPHAGAAVECRHGLASTRCAGNVPAHRGG